MTATLTPNRTVESLTKGQIVLLSIHPTEDATTAESELLMAVFDTVSYGERAARFTDFSGNGFCAYKYEDAWTIGGDAARFTILQAHNPLPAF